MKKILLVLFSFFGIGLFLHNNTYAVSDFTQVVTQPSGTILSNCDITCYNQYHYMILEWTPITGNNSLTLKANFTYNGTTMNRFVYLTAYLGYAIIDIQNLSSVFNTDGVWPNIPVTITLTENLPGDSTPIPEPDCPDPEENSQYMNVVLDSFWKYQKAFAGAVVAILVIFIVYRLIKGILR